MPPSEVEKLLIEMSAEYDDIDIMEIVITE
jgi:hypothetical protein